MTTLNQRADQLGLACSERYLPQSQIDAAKPRDPSCSSLAEARRTMMATGQWSPAQFMGRRWPIGCVALEITQRCNLDCTACYLSEHSEAVKDLPLEEVFRRIDMIHQHYGDTDIQITGGDPTLRKRDELVAIVRRIAAKKMRAALFTNGIRAKRDLLDELAQAGLVDVAFHVDVTQQRRGYNSEKELNAIRLDYIERARGLPLSVLFNTTVCNDNFEQIPDVAEFFVHHSDVVRLASFQLQADTGRTVLGRRDAAITVRSVQQQIERGAGTALSFDTAHIGHSRCNRCAIAFVTNGHAYDVLDAPSLFQLILARTAHLSFDRRSRARAVRTFLAALLVNPALWGPVAAWLCRKIWWARSDLIAARGRVHKLSFFIHNFMDACRLEPERIDACTFMAMTRDGTISMCLHNAKRDSFILTPLHAPGSQDNRPGAPLTGRATIKGQPAPHFAEPAAKNARERPARKSASS